MEKKIQKSAVQGAGFLLVLSLQAAAFAKTPVPAPSPDLNSRFEQLETRITSLQNQLVEQSKKHLEAIEELRRQIEIHGPEEKAVYLPPSPEAGPKWLEGLTMGGDFRLRYEAFEQNEATRERNRFRYRLRWKITKQLTDDLELGFRLVNGSTTDPTSTNQTMTGDFTYKSFLLDQAYVKYRPSFLADFVPFLEKSEFAGGKFENPFLAASSAMVWDADAMPEGFYEAFEFGFFEGKLKPFVTLGQYVLQENATLADAELYGVQSGVRWKPPGFSKEAEAQVTHALA
jgi:hypothetical protein